MKARILMFVTLSLGGCDSRSANSRSTPLEPTTRLADELQVTSTPEGVTAAPTSVASAAASGDPAPEPQRLGAVSLPDLPRCVSACTQRNMMRAVSADEIAATCKNDCLDQCFELCKPKDDRPASFEATCRKDCNDQLDGP